VRSDIYDLVVIGGGAAGFFGAIQAAEHRKGIRIIILEKSTKVLSKVRVSGGGRCNVTHSCFNPFELADHYPRGEKQLKQLFKQFHAQHMVEWLEARGVELKTENDKRMFPKTNSSETIIECFLEQTRKNKIEIALDREVVDVSRSAEWLEVKCSDITYCAFNVLIASGGNPKFSSYSWIQKIGHTLIPPIPSLFTFNDSDKEFADLMGVAVANATIKIASTRFTQTGPILITHWGLSGPAVIKLSAWAAQWLHEKNYEFTALVNWLGPVSEDEGRGMLVNMKTNRPKQRIISNPIGAIPIRLWERLCDKSEIENVRLWGEISNRSINRLLEFLIRCPFIIKGKTTFKEEFVTCGGVSLDEIDIDTMGSKVTNGIYFAGEVVNIDGETGGFNFQSAWTTAYIAGRSVAGNLKAKITP
jgi:predicted Rossmann fold flavoprotein